MNFFNNSPNKTDNMMKKAFCLMLVLIMLFSAGTIAGSLSEKGVKISFSADTPVRNSVNIEDNTEGNSSYVPPVNTPDNQVTPPSDTSDGTSSDSASDTQTDTQTGTPSKTKEEIITLFNEAANKVKTEATKVTRNFKNTRYDSEKSVLPSALQSMANPMMEKYVKDDTEPVDYLTAEEIIENFPAPKQTYSSVLTAADVTDATCNDNGTEYEITLNLAPSTNPTAGTGVGAACHIMDVTSITSSEGASSMIKKFDAIYEGCVIRCKIDKASNRITWANYHTPFTIDAVVNVVFSEIATTVVMLYERDYTITY